MDADFDWWRLLSSADVAQNFSELSSGKKETSRREFRRHLAGGPDDLFAIGNSALRTTTITFRT
jgi:hypothetical protein